MTVQQVKLSDQGKAIVQQASKIAEDDLRTASKQVKDAVADGHLTKSFIRDLMAAWGRGDYLWPFEYIP